MPMGSPARAGLRILAYLADHPAADAGAGARCVLLTLAARASACRWPITALVLPHPRLPRRRCAATLGRPARAAVRRQPHLLSRYRGPGQRSSRAPSSPRREVAGWPFFGWLAKLQRTVFVDRRASQGTASTTDEIAEAARSRATCLILFPEGTSDDGNRAPALQERAVQRRRAAASRARRSLVQPVSIAYTRLDGMPMGRSFRPFFAWYGDMALAPHLWRMLGLGVSDRRGDLPRAGDDRPRSPAARRWPSIAGAWCPKGVASLAGRPAAAPCRRGRPAGARADGLAAPARPHVMAPRLDALTTPLGCAARRRADSMSGSRPR